MPTNASLGIISAFCTAILLFLAIVVWLRRSERPSSKSILITLFFALIWALSYTLFYLLPDDNAALFMHEFQFIGVCLAPVFLFDSIMKITGSDRSIRREYLFLLCVIPFTTIVLALTNNTHFLFRQSITLITEPYRVASYVNGPWFYLNSVYLYLIIFMAAAYLCHLLRIAPDRNKIKIIALIFAVLSPVILNLIKTLVLIDTNYDLTILGNAIGMCIIVYVEFLSLNNSYLSLSRDLVFQKLSNPTLILDNNRMVVDANIQAKNLSELLTQKGMKEYMEEPFDKMFHDFSGAPACKITESDDKTTQMIVYSTDGKIQEVYKLNTSPLSSSSGSVLGYCIEFINITSEFLLMIKANRLATIDSLTGLKNRTQYERTLKRIDSEASLPLGIINIDVNNLKTINDNYGHETGDLLLKSVAKAINNALPEAVFKARIGGDEFTILLPNTNQYEIEIYAENILKYCNTMVPIKGETVSISLGYAIRTTMDASLNDILKTADRKMYEMKAEYYAHTGQGRRESDH